MKDSITPIKEAKHTPELPDPNKAFDDFDNSGTFLGMTDFEIWEHGVMWADRTNNRAPKLQEFKDYVHKRLDDAGIEKEPNGEHSKAGCRIGDRLDIVLDQLTEIDDLLELVPENERLRERNRVLEEALRGYVHEFDDERFMTKRRKELLDKATAVLSSNESADKPERYYDEQGG